MRQSQGGTLFCGFLKSLSVTVVPKGSMVTMSTQDTRQNSGEGSTATTDPKGQKGVSADRQARELMRENPKLTYRDALRKVNAIQFADSRKR